MPQHIAMDSMECIALTSCFVHCLKTFLEILSNIPFFLYTLFIFNNSRNEHFFHFPYATARYKFLVHYSFNCFPFFLAVFNFIILQRKFVFNHKFYILLQRLPFMRCNGNRASNILHFSLHFSTFFLSFLFYFSDINFAHWII